MLKVERFYDKFTVKVSDPPLGSYVVPCADLDEVCMAVRHYYGDKGHKMPVEGCPTCRSIAESHCKKCGSKLTKAGYCKDKACPYSDRKQGEA